ncbi:MAG: BatA and WFA domain-containing protein [bacterium]|nr:BatA and WFA domain-containing protein [bacterium]
MTFTAPFGLLALLAVPAVVALHLYRRRLQERRVAAVFLFVGERLVTDAGRTRTRLLRTPSLWLECLMAALLALWLAGPSFGGIAARHVVFVLDDSASMSVADAEPARAAVRERLDDLRSQDRVTVLRTGPRGEILVGPRALPSEVEPALADWRPARPRHDPLPALDLARELATSAADVVYFTDEPTPFGIGEIHVVAMGEAQGNAAILSAQRFRRAAGGEELRVRVAAYGRTAPSAITIRNAQGAELVRGAIQITDGAADLTVPLPEGTGPIVVELPDDALAIDNEAWLAPEPLRTVRVCDLLSAESRRRLELDRVFAALDGHVLEPDALTAQLVLAERAGHPLAGQTEVVITAGDGERDGWRGPFVVDRGHPWLVGLQLAGVVWLAGSAAPPGRILAAAGNRALMTEEFVAAGRRLWVNLDAAAGNLVRSPDWPLLFANLLDSCRSEVPGPVQANVVLGEEMRFRRTLVAESADAELELELPDGTRELGRGDRIVGWIAAQPGLHRVLDRDGLERAAIAARFHDPSESDLRGLVTRTVAAADDQAGDGPLRDTTIERRLLGLLLLLCALADWWVLAPALGSTMLGRRRQ